MKTFSFFLVPSYSSSKWLDEKMMQMTKSFVSILNVLDYPVYEIEKYDDINHYIKKYDYIVVVTAGNIFVRRDHLWNKVHSLNPKIGLIANLLQHENETPWFHEQFFIINTKAFTNLNFEEGPCSGKELVRSREDMHDGHAPLYIELGNNIINRQDQFGTKLIEQALSNGFEVTNWDEDWRYPKDYNNYVTGIRLPSRGYVYPKKNTEHFEKALKTFNTINQELDESQKLFIDSLDEIQQFRVLNAWHYENSDLNQSVDTIIAPATGFLAETLAYKGKAKNIIFYDVNENNIKFKEYLYSKWNGISYDRAVKDFASDRNLKIEPLEKMDLKIAQSQSLIAKEKILPEWNEWKQSVNCKFILCDCIKEIDSLLNYINGTTVVNTSTILSEYPFSAIFYDPEEIKNARTKLKNAPVIWLER